MLQWIRERVKRWRNGREAKRYDRIPWLPDPDQTDRDASALRCPLDEDLALIYGWNHAFYEGGYGYHLCREHNELFGWYVDANGRGEGTPEVERLFNRASDLGRNIKLLCHLRWRQTADSDEEDVWICCENPDLSLTLLRLLDGEDVLDTEFHYTLSWTNRVVAEYHDRGPLNCEGNEAVRWLYDHFRQGVVESYQYAEADASR